MQSTRSASTMFLRISPSPAWLEDMEPLASTNPAKPVGARGNLGYPVGSTRNKLFCSHLSRGGRFQGSCSMWTTFRRYWSTDLGPAGSGLACPSFRIGSTERACYWHKNGELELFNITKDPLELYGPRMKRPSSRSSPESCTYTRGTLRAKGRTRCSSRKGPGPTT